MNGQLLFFPFFFLLLLPLVLVSYIPYTSRFYLFFFFFIGLEGALSLAWKSPINLPRHLLFAVFFTLIGCPFSSCPYPNHPPPSPIFFFSRWMCIYLLPIFIYGKRLKSAQVTIRCDGDATELKGNEKCREKKQQERRCHWNRPSFSNNFL